MQYFCGIDIGAYAAKLVIIAERGQVVAKAMRRSGVDYAQAAEHVLADALEAASLERSQLLRSLATGYGRDNVPWTDGKKTEIACHGKGAYFTFRKAMTVVDIGAQDSKVIHLDEAGHRTGFKMNRKCAAGTGAFLEEIAHRLAVDLSDLNALAERSTMDAPLSSFCTVFAATEVLGRIRAGEKVHDIVRAAFCSVVKRIIEMDRVDGMLVTTGGVVAHNPFLAQLLGKALGTEALTPPDAQYTGAFGAALFAIEENEKG